MKPDNLDQLSDAQLSETFAAEVVGARTIMHPEGALVHVHESIPLGMCNAGDFATSADAVLPWMEKVTFRVEYNPNCPSKYLIRMSGKGRGRIDGLSYYGIGGNAPTKDSLTFGSTFARAACIALIRAKRAGEGGAA